ncbi:hypothetical protein Gasu_07430 isoform 2 [Galdieria sulphuraria]|uniref:Uncharacterized protein n=1 Tax=Galdieria sulphuraria TaxID=130081 RepID=M2W819_GALSU|nr:hypothetical protein Gasu_07430 isoform 2 [Galdieria sulphuraria]EME31996.1 hypothetical protein Gasu_07430 isoform 2 [Galdieria sulphuraria]|eukprot:XP_005708516.1 hypothetical protein isoform 2 [Galdieria sulphuraria]
MELAFHIASSISAFVFITKSLGGSLVAPDNFTMTIIYKVILNKVYVLLGCLACTGCLKDSSTRSDVVSNIEK